MGFKRAPWRGIKLTNVKRMDDSDDDGNSFHENLQLDNILHKIILHILKCLKLLLMSKYNSRNLVSAMDIWTIAVVCYSAPDLKWTRVDINQLDHISRKAITLYNTFHSETNVHKLYIKKCKSWGELLGVLKCINSERINMTEYLVNSKEALPEYVANEEGFINDEFAKEFRSQVFKREKKLYSAWNYSFTEKLKT